MYYYTVKYDNVYGYRGEVYHYVNDAIGVHYDSTVIVDYISPPDSCFSSESQALDDASDWAEGHNLDVELD